VGSAIGAREHRGFLSPVVKVLNLSDTSGEADGRPGLKGNCKWWKKWTKMIPVINYVVGEDISWERMGRISAGRGWR